MESCAGSSSTLWKRVSLVLWLMHQEVISRTYIEQQPPASGYGEGRGRLGCYIGGSRTAKEVREDLQTSRSRVWRDNFSEYRQRFDQCTTKHWCGIRESTPGPGYDTEHQVSCNVLIVVSYTDWSSQLRRARTRSEEGEATSTRERDTAR